MNMFEKTSSGELDMIPPSHLVKVINQILDDAKEPFEHPVGILTGGTRDAWYSSREMLLKRLLKMLHTLTIIILLTHRPNQSTVTGLHRESLYTVLP